MGYAKNTFHSTGSHTCTEPEISSILFQLVEPKVAPFTLGVDVHYATCCSDTPTRTKMSAEMNN